MECPFELPVSKELMQNEATFVDGKIKLFRIKPLLIPYTEEEADYIVQAINSHEKYKIAFENIVGLETECCYRCEGNGRLYADGKAHLPSENADTILCGDCGGSGRILPEDAQEIASEALEGE